jgi:hypothetical protein
LPWNRIDGLTGRIAKVTRGREFAVACTKRFLFEVCRASAGEPCRFGEMVEVWLE